MKLRYLSSTGKELNGSMWCKCPYCHASMRRKKLSRVLAERRNYGPVTGLWMHTDCAKACDDKMTKGETVYFDV